MTKRHPKQNLMSPIVLRLLGVSGLTIGWLLACLGEQPVARFTAVAWISGVAIAMFIAAKTPRQEPK